MNQPMTAGHAEHGNHAAHGLSELQEASNTNRKVGFWIFLSSELLIFCGLIFSFALVRLSAFQKGKEFIESIHWPEATTLSITLVSINTFVLLFSSVAVVVAINAIRENNNKRMFIWLLVTTVCGIIFLGGQAVEYNLLINEERQNLTTTFGGPFFTLTGFHGLHVFVGVLWCIAVLLRARKTPYTASNHTTVEIFGLFWHFVDLVWIIIFTVVYLISDQAW
jgi:cytochrome c oxidase subunit 3/cytochrome o ubiquinol oxidase subunit 3